MGGFCFLLLARRLCSENVFFCVCWPLSELVQTQGVQLQQSQSWRNIRSIKGACFCTSQRQLNQTDNQAGGWTTEYCLTNCWKASYYDEWRCVKAAWISGCNGYVRCRKITRTSAYGWAWRYSPFHSQRSYHSLCRGWPRHKWIRLLWAKECSNLQAWFCNLA